VSVQLKLVATDGYGATSSRHLRVIVLEVVIPVFPQYTEASRVSFTYSIHFNQYILSASMA